MYEYNINRININKQKSILQDSGSEDEKNNITVQDSGSEDEENNITER